MRLALTAALAAAVLQAHDLEVAVTATSPAVVTRSAYAGTDPAPLAKVTIYSLRDGKKEFQNGRTDLNGNFAFVPDAIGDWLFVVDDEEGHIKEIKITAGGGAPHAPSQRGSVRTLWDKTLLGVSLILGLTGLLYGYMAHRNARA